LLRSETPYVALDFGHWTGLVYVAAQGQDGPSSPDNDIQTRFINIPLGVKRLGVVNFNGIVIFGFAPPPPNSLASFHPVDLFLVNNHRGGEIYINTVSALHIHATGTNGPQILHADADMITVDRDGDVNLQHSSSFATTMDASAATGSCILSVLSDRSVTVTAGRGFHNTITTNGNSDRIDFLKDHTGRNTYIPLNFSIPVGVATTPYGLGGISVTDDSLNAQAIQIKNFIPTLDKIDFRKMKPIPTLPYELAITHEDLSSQPTLKAAAEFAAAHNAHKGKHTINVFQYKCTNEDVRSTYVFNDQSGDQQIGYGDGLIKLVGVSNRGSTDFVTLSEFITP
jgi:hypothetical protein